MPETTSHSDVARLADMVRRRLGVSLGDAPAPMDPTDVADYDWTTPCLYTAVERQRLDTFAARMLPAVRTALTKALRLEFPLTPRSAATAYFHQCDEGQCYALPLLCESAVAGLLRIDAPLAGACVERLLGGPGDLPGQGRELSSLENSLLLDLCATLGEAFAKAYRDAGGPTLTPAGELAKNRLPLPFPPEHEMVRFALAAANQLAPPLTFLFPHERLDFIAAGLPAPVAEPAPDECRARLLEAVHDADLNAEIWLRAASTTMNDVLALEPDDVILLPQEINEPVNVTLYGRKLFQGLLGAQHGHYAMEILSVHP
ncbi:MAG: FliM/FliN family flagellar motor switch protein [Phycisphaerae bacterium]|nr:FliM/FliN family flagellar motor switch protein [Phycisphaerae bacterium]